MDAKPGSPRLDMKPKRRWLGGREMIPSNRDPTTG